jgi:hypothetical protein
LACFHGRNKYSCRICKKIRDPRAREAVAGLGRIGEQGVAIGLMLHYIRQYRLEFTVEDFEILRF